MNDMGDQTGGKGSRTAEGEGGLRGEPGLQVWVVVALMLHLLCHVTPGEAKPAQPPSCSQGSLRAYIPANNKTTPGPKFMERGEIGWAGGSSGPDWFIYLGTQVAALGVKGEGPGGTLVAGIWGTSAGSERI